MKFVIIEGLVGLMAIFKGEFPDKLID
jgi:hypothetical protein